MGRRKGLPSVTRVMRGVKGTLRLGRAVFGIKRRRTKGLIRVSRVKLFSTRRRKSKGIVSALFRPSEKTNTWVTHSRTKKVKKAEWRAFRSAIVGVFSLPFKLSKKGRKRRRKKHR